MSEKEPFSAKPLNEKTKLLKTIKFGGLDEIRFALNILYGKVSPLLSREHIGEYRNYHFKLREKRTDEKNRAKRDGSYVELKKPPIDAEERKLGLE